MPKYLSRKTYDHSVGLSAVFRQPLAQSHCKFLHGYSLAFTFTFGCDRLDSKNWCVDFGGLGELKGWLVSVFDHKLIVDNSDPRKDKLLSLGKHGLAQVVTMNGVGCEKFAEHAFEFANTLISAKTNGRCWCVSVECSEHGGNSATFTGR